MNTSEFIKETQSDTEGSMMRKQFLMTILKLPTPYFVLNPVTISHDAPKKLYAAMGACKKR